jgi:hypothetical protein
MAINLIEKGVFVSVRNDILPPVFLDLYMCGGKRITNKKH